MSDKLFSKSIFTSSTLGDIHVLCVSIKQQPTVSYQENSLLDIGINSFAEQMQLCFFIQSWRYSLFIKLVQIKVNHPNNKKQLHMHVHVHTCTCEHWN